MFTIISFFQKLIKVFGIRVGGGRKIFQKLTSGGMIIQYSRVEDKGKIELNARTFTVLNSSGEIFTTPLQHLR